MKIVCKDSGENNSWLELCELSESYANPGKLLTDIVSILKVLGKIISTAKS